MSAARSVEAVIREVMERGEFDDLPGKGKPRDLSAYFDTHKDVRLAYASLKDAGDLPTEIELLRGIEALQQACAAAADEKA